MEREWSTSVVVIHYKEVLYQVYVPLPFKHVSKTSLYKGF